MGKRILQVGYLTPRVTDNKNTVYCRVFQEEVDAFMRITSSEGIICPKNNTLDSPINYLKKFGLSDEDARNEIETYIQQLASLNDLEIEDRRTRDALELTEKIYRLGQEVDMFCKETESLKKRINLFD
jgi:hypothetical protein